MNYPRQKRRRIDSLQGKEVIILHPEIIRGIACELLEVSEVGYLFRRTSTPIKDKHIRLTLIDDPEEGTLIACKDALFMLLPENKNEKK